MNSEDNLNSETDSRSIRMKKKFIVFLFLFATMFSGVYAVESGVDGYIIKIKNDYQTQNEKISLMSIENDFNSLKSVAKDWGMYYISKEEYESFDKSIIEYAEPDLDIYLLEDDVDDEYYNLQWNMPMINAEYAWNFNYLGSGIKVGVIDSGTSPTHPDLINSVKAAYDMSDGKTLEDNLNPPDGTTINGQDEIGHGTKVSGIIAAQINNKIGVAGLSQAELYSFNIINSNGKGKVKDFISAMEAALKSECDIINMSIGFTVDSSQETDLNELQSVNEALEKLNDAGIIVVAASGNNASNEKDTNKPNYPAYSDKVIGVGAVDMYKKITYYSTHNDKVDISAPGGGGTLSKGVYSTSLNNSYGYDSGTSFASPHVAAAAAVIKGIIPSLNHDNFEKIIKYASDDVTEKGYNEYYGWGVLNIKKMIDLAKPKSIAVYMSTPVYDKTSNKLSIDILNPSQISAKENICVLLAVYSDNTLQCVSDIQYETISPFFEKTVVFEDVFVNENSSVKVMCFTDVANISPMCEPAVLSNAE